MLLSVVIPVYNVEKYLEECINSVICDSEDLEIILVNDGSKDTSLNICEEYRDKYANIKLVDKENGGLSSARNAGLEIAKGKYVLFLDSDDYLVKGSIPKIMEYISDKNTDVIMSGYYEVCDDKIEETVDFNIDINADIDSIREQIFNNDDKCIWTAWKFLVRREFLEEKEIIFKEGYLHEDVDYTVKILLAMNTFNYMELTWYCYRVSRDGSIMNKRKIKSSIHTARIIVDLEKEIKESKEENKFYDLVMRKLSNTFFTTIRYSVNSTDEELKELSSLVSENKFLLESSNRRKHRVFNSLQKNIGFYNIIKLAKLFK
ncbi:MAG: glycosyltransferase family 2 protein [Sarcina sp.]